MSSIASHKSTVNSRKEKPPDQDTGNKKSTHSLQPMPSPKRNRVTSPKSKDVRELTRLLDYLKSTPPLPPLPKRNADSPRRPSVWPNPQPVPPLTGPQSTAAPSQHIHEEAALLEKFSLTYQEERHFSEHKQCSLFSQILNTLVNKRLLCREWMEFVAAESIRWMLVCLRILMRDSKLQRQFIDLGAIPTLTHYLQKVTDTNLSEGYSMSTIDILKEMTNIYQKLSGRSDQRELLIRHETHKYLVQLLWVSDIVVLHCTLHALITLSQSAGPQAAIVEQDPIDALLNMLQKYDIATKCLAAAALQSLCSTDGTKKLLSHYDGIPLLLSVLHSDNVGLLWQVVWCLVLLSSDADTSNEIRLTGGIPLLLSLLHDRNFTVDESPTMSSPLPEEDHFNFTKESFTLPKQSEKLKKYILSLKSAVCACLAELTVNDTNAQQIVQGNGIYLVAKLLLPDESLPKALGQHSMNLQCNAFRTLRFLFSMERNRRKFKQLFPPNLFNRFISVGHYVRTMSDYKKLVVYINELPESDCDLMYENIELMNENRDPSHYIGDYAVLDLLGRGGFGSVYKVRHKDGQSCLAMKELNAPSIGRNTKERDTNLKEVLCELSIIKEQLRHQNVVRYHKTFVIVDKLYIVMELIEGAPLMDHFTSLKEKNEYFTEERIWKIFVQMVLALRYLHTDKQIIHRDFTPNNVMLGENDKVTITDFGLAKQKQKDCSKMLSVVGTILYSCPEIIQHEAYSEKADIWSLGCLLYQMCTLKAPFYSNNLVTLSKKIVEADYEPIPKNRYSDKVVSTVQICITASPAHRADIVKVAEHIAVILMTNLDTVRKENQVFEKKLEHEKRRSKRDHLEANRRMEGYSSMSRVLYDKLANLAGSGGAPHIRDLDESSDDLTKPPVSQTYCRQVSAIQDDHSHNGICSDDDFASSNDSRESSSGRRPPRPPSAKYRKHRTSHHSETQLNDELTLDISTSSGRYRDSGMSSGDPSPNVGATGSVLSPDDSRRLRLGVNRSSSSSSIDGLLRKPRSAGSNSKGTLSISSHRVRQISDPILEMLNVIHKIIYITQLPPPLNHNGRRRAIDAYKRALFASNSSHNNLKEEVKKLQDGSSDFIDLKWGPGIGQSLARQVSREISNESTNSLEIDSDSDESFGITYQRMRTLIEAVLVESGYYDLPSTGHRKSYHQRTDPRIPLSPGVRTDTRGHKGLKSA